MLQMLESSGLGMVLNIPPPHLRDIRINLGLYFISTVLIFLTFVTVSPISWKS